MAQSTTGLCAVYMNNHKHLLIGELETDFPATTLVQADKQLQQVAKLIARYIEHPVTTPILPLDPRGTAFQQRVWAGLQQIPAGNTVSYTELAHKLGLPQGARAVASACAANKIAVIIPCHRVIGSNGALCGYRWGIERKRQLLALEKIQD